MLRNCILENNSPKQLFISLLRTSKENTRKNHFVKSVRIWSYSGPHFPAFGQNSERYKNLSVISPNAGKYKDQNNSEYGHFSRSRWKTRATERLLYFPLRKLTSDISRKRIKSKCDLFTVQVSKFKVCVSQPLKFNEKLKNSFKKLKNARRESFGYKVDMLILTY